MRRLSDALYVADCVGVKTFIAEVSCIVVSYSLVPCQVKGDGIYRNIAFEYREAGRVGYSFLL